MNDAAMVALGALSGWGVLASTGQVLTPLVPVLVAALCLLIPALAAYLKAWLVAHTPKPGTQPAPDVAPADPPVKTT